MYRYVTSICALLVAVVLSAEQPVPPQSEAEFQAKEKKGLTKEVAPTAEETPERAELRALYDQLKAIEAEAMREIRALTEGMDALPSGEREEIQRKVQAIKSRVERQSLDIKRKIALLRGDTRLVSEIDEAIDRLDNPEKYRPKTKKIERKDTPSSSKADGSQVKRQPKGSVR